MKYEIKFVRLYDPSSCHTSSDKSINYIPLLSSLHQRLQVEGLDELVLQRLWFQVNQGVLKKVGVYYFSCVKNFLWVKVIFMQFSSYVEV